MKIKKRMLMVMGCSLIWSLLVTGWPVSAQGDVETELDHYIDGYVDEYRVPGASVILLKDGDVFYSKSWGVTGEEEGKVTADTPFTIGSISKSLTGLGVMKLVDEDLIELDDPVRKHLPWFTLSDEEAAGRITVKQLLTQTSGVGTYTGLIMSDQEANDLSAIRENVKSLADVELSAPVGQKHLYSNSNFMILGALIEEVTGVGFSEYMDQSVLKPLGMEHAAGNREAAYKNGYARGYQSWFGMPVKSSVAYDNGGAPYGYMTASANDMVKFLSFLNGEDTDGLLSEESKSLYLTPHVQTGEDRYYGLGIRVSNPGSPEEMIWHSGSTPDSHSEFFTMPETGWGGVLLTNKNNVLEEEGLYYLKMGIIDILNGNEPGEIPGNTPVIQLILLLVAVLLAGMLVFFIRKPVLKRGRGFVTGSVLIALSFGLIPALSYVSQSPWHAVWMFSPDLAFLVMVIAGLLGLNGIWVFAGAFRKMERTEHFM
ncbi:serine hydrolase domain-containing protein [Rossellomorea oryzaecorticis]|uniref:Serine hydrolase domain-containing protein n=1 Tax=Rossellomorea oryzaecorticis TaxID=1396505 RepID=A0ABW8VLG6_9BACI